MAFSITLLPGASRFRCDTEQNLLQALQQAGAVPDLIGAIPVGCRGGGCGVCRIRVVSGDYRTGKMSRKHISEADAAAGLLLACRVYPDSDLQIEVCTP